MDLIKYLVKISNDLRMLNSDIAKVIVKKGKEIQDAKGSDSNSDAEKNESGLKLSFSSLQQITKIRKSKEDIKNAKEDPDTTFIIDQINEIFK